VSVQPIARPAANVTVVDIDPATAHRWLSTNTENRNLRPRVVDTYAQDMTEGRWLFNGEAIKFDANGVLLDGQHRLHAIVKSGATIRALVVNGLDAKSQDTMDAGSRRTAADALRLDGRSNYTSLASVARAGLLWDRGERNTSISASRVSTGQIVEYVDANPDVITASEIASHYRARIPAPVSATGLAFLIFSRIDRDEAELFFMDVAEGANLPSGDPALALRNRLLNLQSQGGGGRPHQTQFLRLFIRAWNARREGRTLKNVSMNVKAHAASTNLPDPR